MHVIAGSEHRHTIILLRLWVGNGKTTSLQFIILYKPNGRHLWGASNVNNVVTHFNRLLIRTQGTVRGKNILTLQSKESNRIDYV